MSELTGIKIVAKNGTHSLDMQLLKKMGQVPAKFHFGDVMRPVTSGHGCTPDKPLVLEPLKADPRFAINDPSAKNLASYQGSKETSFAIKDMGDWTSVYIGAPIVPSKILRELAKSSGVHIYLDTDDIVWRNKSFLAIHALTAGPKTIHLPEEMKVMDLFQDNKIISNGKKEFTVNMKKFATKIFYTGKKQWMEEGKKGGKDIQ
jgi:hypothetical protein